MIENEFGSTDTVNEIRDRLLTWFAKHQRPFPWRTTYRPYHVWIAEVMAQQTQMERVVLYFQRWVEQFPDVEAVASAPEQKILKAWEGLGYYTRARNIHRTALYLVSSRGGEIPSDYQQLLALPGIGPYTAAAILSIAFNQPYPLIDANVERIFSRLADIDSPLKNAATRKQLTTMAGTLLDREHPRDFNQALMELGALVCTPKKPVCADCPLRMQCRAHRADTVEFRPLPTARGKKIDIVMACCILHKDDRIFIQQRLPDDIWGSLWEFPGGRLKEGESPVEGALREIREETGWQIKQLNFLATVTHFYTRYRVTLHGFHGILHPSCPKPVLTAASQYAWVTLSQLSQYPFPAGHRQLVDILCA
ncbi:MAG: A/G-specific adenine glycosylase [Desulfobulbus sp.]|nr:A/G-specific adenine glycosylase [Desulfobulbus sp.]